MTLLQAKKILAKKFEKVSPTPALDAEVLLQALLDKDKTFILLNRDFVLDAQQEQRLAEWAALREGGLPVAYITHKKEFYGYDFFVDQSVLIPKPDTEILVARAVEVIVNSIQSGVQQPTSVQGGGATNKITSISLGFESQKLVEAAAPLEVCDMCCGSGCVGLSILRTLVDGGHIPPEHLPQFTLADISTAALEVSKKNAALLLAGKEKSRVKFIQSNLFEAIPQKFDVIVANPPYIPHNEVLALLADGRNEPLLALDGDVKSVLFNSNTPSIVPSGTSDGLEIVRRLVLQAKEHLAPYGVLLMEAGEYNICAAADFLRKNGFVRVRIFKDLEGQGRVVAAVRG